MKRFSTANRIAINHARGFGARASFLGDYMTAPTYFERDPDYTGFYLHHCVHYLDLVPHLMGRPAEIRARRHDCRRAGCCCMSTSPSRAAGWARW